jgi:enoyl-CoA hydratase/carnithine racemase
VPTSDAPTHEALLVDIAEGVATITLNRPDKLNACDATLLDEIAGVYQDLRYDDDVRALVLTGAGDRAFCTGVDRSLAMDIPQPSSPFMQDDPMWKLAPKTADLWKPMVVAVNGMAAGGAFYAIGESEIVVAAEHATFFDPHTTYGMAACFEPMLLFGQMPWGELCRMSLLGAAERISAATAQRMGLVSEVVPADELLATAQGLAREIAALPPVAVQGTLKSLWAARTMARGQALDAAASLVALGQPADDKAAGQAVFASGARVEPRVR